LTFAPTFPDATRSCDSNFGCAVRLSIVVPHDVPAFYPKIRASSLGIVQRSPLRRITRQGVHSRSTIDRSPDRPSSIGMQLPRCTLVPAPWFCATSPVCSSLPGRVYCNAFPTLGFTTFPQPPTVNRSLRTNLPASTRFPVMPSCPPKPSLRAQRLVDPLTREIQRERVTARTVTRQDVHRTPCPLAVAASPALGSCLPISRSASRPQGLAPCPGPLPLRPLPATSDPVLPWA
jgi:hypothetical protein